MALPGGGAYRGSGPWAYGLDLSVALIGAFAFLLPPRGEALNHHTKLVEPRNHILQALKS